MSITSVDNSTVKGWLGKREGTGLGDGGGAGSRNARGTTGGGYKYGYPSGGPVEPNVAAQWLFDEASGNIVDEVGGVTLTADSGMTYSVNTSSYSTFMQLGINVTTSRKQFASVATSHFNLGTGNGVVELVTQFPSAPAGVDAYFFTTASSAIASGLYFYHTLAANGTYLLSITADDGTQVTLNMTNPFSGNAPTVSGIWSKWRIVINRAGNIELFHNGVSLGSGSIATLVGKSITASASVIGGRWDAFRNEDNCTYNEFRFTAGNATNNSGGPGGG